MHQDTDITKFVGQAIRQFRRLNNLSLNEMADRLGVSYQQLQKYETGANRISANTLFNLAQLIGVSVISFFPAGNLGLTAEQVNMAQNYGKIRDDEVKKSLLDLTCKLSATY